jgi:hypothetical protein
MVVELSSSVQNKRYNFAFVFKMRKKAGAHFPLPEGNTESFAADLEPNHTNHSYDVF